MTTRLISVDSHVKMTPEQIKAHMPSKFHRDFDDAIAAEAAAHQADMGGLDPKVLAAGFSHEAMTDPGYHEPHARLQAMDRDGVEAEVLYSEVSAFRHYPYMKDGFREASDAFNRVFQDFASADPKRLVPAYQVPLMDIDFAVKQVQALASDGARAVHIPTFPSEVGLPEYHDERYDPVWAAISESGMKISQHLGLVASLFDLLRRDPTPQKAIFTSQPCLRLAETIGFWILPGVLARFPELKIVLVEPSLGWVPFYLDVLDSFAEGPYDFPALDEKPSSYFHRQMYLTFVDDPRGLEHRHDLGVDRIMWSTDFPHPATSWPNSHAIVEKNFAGIPDDERDLIVSGNAARVYGF
ncbi:MAG TPA: amidohydrolase family protein [Acidimicrobiia bacterium]|nr:amidohydrolase family protein [Acidimicrobiia bacterium]